MHLIWNDTKAQIPSFIAQTIENPDRSQRQIAPWLVAQVWIFVALRPSKARSIHMPEYTQACPRGRPLRDCDFAGHDRIVGEGLASGFDGIGII
ncbi:hypothetical protein GGE12_001713 [Rhizobium mongolense]|uniref:Uncharacterized protein n=1 Tax=Rhizobium mongolense TaxID=57676 RepID=A0A7W6RK48_9HYPH|nr:hypothetical protein [Rhizobium mongolense]